MTTTRTNRRLALVFSGLLSLGIVGLAGPAGADIGDITSCPAPVDCDGPDTPDGPDDLTTPTADPDPEPDPDPDLPEGQPEADDDPLPPAPTGDVVVADANFTG